MYVPGYHHILRKQSPVFSNWIGIGRKLGSWHETFACSKAEQKGNKKRIKNAKWRVFFLSNQGKKSSKFMFSFLKRILLSSAKENLSISNKYEPIRPFSRPKQESNSSKALSYYIIFFVLLKSFKYPM
jgi:hypothetical protein